MSLFGGKQMYRKHVATILGTAGLLLGAGLQPVAAGTLPVIHTSFGPHGMLLVDATNNGPENMSIDATYSSTGSEYFVIEEVNHSITEAPGCVDLGGQVRCTARKGVKIQTADAADAVNVHMTGSNPLIIQTFGGNDAVFVTGYNKNTTIYSGTGGDFIQTREGPQKIYLGWGNDAVQAGAGDDVIEGYHGDDALYGQKGNDVIKGGPQADYLDGDNGQDVLKGGWGDDNLLGGPGADTIQGNQGNDWLNGGKSNDKMWGGYGNDSFWDSPGAYPNGDDLFSGNDGYDIMELGAYSAPSGPIKVSLDNVANDGFLEDGYGDDVRQNIEVVDGSEFSDRLVGNPNGPTTLAGNGGNDVLYSTKGAATLIGGLGADNFRARDTHAPKGDVVELCPAQGDTWLLNPGIDTVNTIC